MCALRYGFPLSSRYQNAGEHGAVNTRVASMFDSVADYPYLTLKPSVVSSSTDSNFVIGQNLPFPRRFLCLIAHTA